MFSSLRFKGTLSQMIHAAYPIVCFPLIWLFAFPKAENLNEKRIKTHQAAPLRPNAHGLSGGLARKVTRRTKMFNLSATRIISYWWKALPVLDMAASRLSCDVMQLFCGPILQEETRRQKRPTAPARVTQEKYNDSFWPEMISMDGLFVENGRPIQATCTKADFCNSRKKQKQGLLIWSKMR